MERERQRQSTCIQPRYLFCLLSLDFLGHHRKRIGRDTGVGGDGAGTNGEGWRDKGRERWSLFYGFESGRDGVVSAATHTREQKKMREQVLERLAVSEPRELLEEAKVELCRATRDLRSCGRVVHHVLSSCGHASLCVECRKRCDYCPICRTPVSSSTSAAAAAPDRLRLYELCVEAGLVVQDDGDDAQQSPSLVSPDDVRSRLCSFFDVALDNNLVCLVCHCIQYTVCLLLLLVLEKPSTHSLSPLLFLFFSLPSFLPSCMYVLFYWNNPLAASYFHSPLHHQLLTMVALRSTTLTSMDLYIFS